MFKYLFEPPFPFPFSYQMKVYGRCSARKKLWLEREKSASDEFFPPPLLESVILSRLNTINKLLDQAVNFTALRSGQGSIRNFHTKNKTKIKYCLGFFIQFFALRPMKCVVPCRLYCYNHNTRFKCVQIHL